MSSQIREQVIPDTVTGHPRYGNNSWMNFRYKFSNFSIDFCRVSISGQPFQHTPFVRCRIPSGFLTIIPCVKVPRSLRPSNHAYLLHLHGFFGIPWAWVLGFCDSHQLIPEYLKHCTLSWFCHESYYHICCGTPL